MDPMNQNVAADDDIDEEEEEDAGDTQLENAPPPPLAAVYIVDPGGNGQEVLPPVAGVSEADDGEEEDGGGGRGLEGDGREGGTEEDDEEEEEEDEEGEEGPVGNARTWRDGHSELGCNELSGPRRGVAATLTSDGALEEEEDISQDDEEEISQDDDDDEEEDEEEGDDEEEDGDEQETRAAAAAAAAGNNNPRKRSSSSNDRRTAQDENNSPYSYPVTANNNNNNNNDQNSNDDDLVEDDGGMLEDREANDAGGVRGSGDDDEEEDEEDDAPDGGDEQRTVGSGQRRWGHPFQLMEQYGATGGITAIGRHLQDFPRPQALTFVGDNRIVFVGEFQVKIGSQWVGENTTKRIYSHTVTDSKGWEWRLMLMPDGNSSEASGWLSVFVEHVNKDFIRMQEPGFARYMRLGFALLPADPAQIRTSDTLHRAPLRHNFQHRYADFGYPRCWNRSEVLVPSDYTYLNRHDRIRISTFIEDIPDSKVSPSHDSKKKTGMVGLKNQGATCYMNSLLQTLFHVLSLRKAVYDIPTDGDNSVTSMALALQRVFYRLQTSDKSVGTKELTKSFGWDAYDSFTQQDVQELNRVLCDHLEDKMKGTPVEGTIQRLFEGSIRSYIKCVNVDFTSAREETYYDIQLDVKGCKDIHESFAKYVEEEMLDGENKYDAGDEHGRQDAKKGVKFLRFPPVLTIHLKRFEYDMTTCSMIKVNDRFAFPRQMDIDQYLGEEAERDPNRPNRYILHSVLVHSGDVHGGHYFAYIRPDGRVKGGQWCKFNDDVVTQVDESEAIEGSYGAGPDALEEKYRDPYTFFPRDGDCSIGPGLGENTSAYMLVYVRECDLPKTMLDLSGTPDNGIPRRLRGRFQREEEDQQRRMTEKNEAHLYLILRVAQDKDLDGVRTVPIDEFVKWDETLKVKVKRRDPAEEIVRVVAKEVGIRPDRCRLWICCSRENKTYRPESAVQGPWDGPMTVEQMMGDLGSTRMFGGVESYNMFVEEVGKHDPVKLEPKGKPELEAAADTKRLRLEEDNGKVIVTKENTLTNATVKPAEVKVKTEGECDEGREESKGDDAMEMMKQEDKNGKQGGGDMVLDEEAMMDRLRAGDAYEIIFNEHVLCFFKMYDPDTRPQPTLSYVGYSVLKGEDSSALLGREAARLAGLPPDTALDLYEQVTPRIINELPQDRTLHENELQHGDMILFQRRPPPDPPTPPPVTAADGAAAASSSKVEAKQEGVEESKTAGGASIDVKVKKEGWSAGGAGADVKANGDGEETSEDQKLGGRKRGREGEGAGAEDDVGQNGASGGGTEQPPPAPGNPTENGNAAHSVSASNGENASPIGGTPAEAAAAAAGGTNPGGPNPELPPPVKRSKSDGDGGLEIKCEGAGVKMEVDADKKEETEEKEEVETRNWTGLAGAKRDLVERVWRVSGHQATVKKFFEHKVSKRVVHFLGRTDRDKILLPEGSGTQDGRSPGISVEMPRYASHREILETLSQRLEMVDDPLLLRVSPMAPGGKPQQFPQKVHLSDLDLPQYGLHKVLEPFGNSSHGNTLLFELLPFPLDKVTHAATLVEAFSSDAILKVYCLARMDEHPVMKLARKRQTARLERAAAAAAAATRAAAAERGRREDMGVENGHGGAKTGKKRKLGEGGVDGVLNRNDRSATTSTTTDLAPSTVMANGHMKNEPSGDNSDASSSPTNASAGPQETSIEDMVLRPPAPDDLIATYVLVKGERTGLDVLRQLAEELRLPESSVARLRMLGTGTGEINAISERNDDVQQFFASRSTQHYCGPIIKEPSNGTIVLEMADDEEVAATFSWGRLPPPDSQPAPPDWMPLQVVMFTINPQGQWAILHGNPMVLFVCENDEVEDIIQRFGRRRGQQALEAAGLRRGRPAVVDNYRPTYLDEEREKEKEQVTGHAGLLPPPPPPPLLPSGGLPPPPPAEAVAASAAVGAAPAATVGVGVAGLGDDSAEAAARGGAFGGSGQNCLLQNGDAETGLETRGKGTLLWRLLKERFPQYVNRGLEDEPMQTGKFPTLGFKKDNPNEQKSYFRRAEQGIRIRGS